MIKLFVVGGAASRLTTLHSEDAVPTLCPMRCACLCIRGIFSPLGAVVSLAATIALRKLLFEVLFDQRPYSTNSTVQLSS